MADALTVVKKTLKKWETSFYKENCRKPSKSDIETAPFEIKDAYKNYAKLKRELCGTADAASLNNSDRSAHEDDTGPYKKSTETGLDKSDRTGPEAANQSHDDVWSTTLNKSTEESKTKSTTSSKVKHSSKMLDKLSNKLFQNSMKFTPTRKFQKQTSWNIPDSECKSEAVGSVTENLQDNHLPPFQDMTTTENQTIQNEAADEIDGEKPFANSIFSRTVKFSKRSFTNRSSDSVDVPRSLVPSCRKKFSVTTPVSKEVKNPFPEDEDEYFSEDKLFSDGPKTSRHTEVVDESLFEQEFCTYGTDFSPKKELSSPSREKRKSCVRGSSFLDKYSQDQSDFTGEGTSSCNAVAESKVQRKTADDMTSELEDSRKRKQTSKRKQLSKEDELPKENEDDSDVKGKGGQVKDKMKGSRKRKLTTDTTSRKKVKVTDGSASLVGGDSANHVPNDVDDEVPKKTSRPLPRKPASSKIHAENFVRLNMKVKKYKRHGRQLTGGQWKRKQWKQKMQARSKSYGDKCFICNETGHWSRDCPNKNGGKKRVVEDIDENDFPSIMDAARMARGMNTVSSEKTSKSSPGTSNPESEDCKKPEKQNPDGMTSDPILDVEMSIVRSKRENIVPPSPMKPFLTKECEGPLTESVPEVCSGLKKFGFDAFRPGQEEAIKRILMGLSTLVVFSTGGGKSLCYQLPAYIYAQQSRCVTLVVSPLVSLMEDQVSGLPPGVRGVCLHSNMTKAQRDGVLAAVHDGNVHFLLVSPEAVVGGGGGLQGSFPPPEKLPRIPFVCIDEAHCLSEWSHNFRPSYLRLCKVLRERYGVRCFLGLTATATQSTAADVCRHLGIEDPEQATIRGPPIPKNLVLSVSQDENRDEALVELLKGDRFSACHSIIIYCTRRELTNRVSTLLRTCMQEEVDLTKPGEKPTGKGKKKKIAVAESYHAGLTAAQRKRVQKNFMSSQLRIVVATVAFGMGLDKPDVRGIIHYNMPKSFEGYVQEIGRAGRDGKTSHCHLFLDPEGRDLCELKRHTYGNTVDRFAVKKLMQAVFKRCRCQDLHQARQTQDADGVEDIKGRRLCPGHERALAIQNTVMALDIREEGISTLLCYLELHPEHWVENLQPAYASCKVICYGGPPQLQAVAKKCPPVAVAIARQKMEGKCFSQSNSVEFPIVEISDTMGWDSGPVKREVKLLQWNWSQQGGLQATSKSGVLVELSDLAFHLRSPGDLSEEEMDNIIDCLHRRVTQQEKTELFQLNLLYNSLKSAAHKSYWMCTDKADQKKSEKLRSLMENFFDAEKSAQTRMEEEEAQANMEQVPVARDLDQLSSDIRQFITIYSHEHSLTGRSIARVFHGIGSPCFPIATWCRVRRFWRSHLHIDFNTVLKTATRELVRMR